MDHSLSVILPVHNAQASLYQQVGQLLELLPDLTTEFDVLIIDDGSTDATEEAAHELAVRFPQVRLIRHPKRLGHQAAVRTGLESCGGEIIFIHDENTAASPGELYRLWQLRRDADLVTARHQPTADRRQEGLLQRLMAWGVALKRIPAGSSPCSGVQMIRRDALHQLGGGHDAAVHRATALAAKARSV